MPGFGIAVISTARRAICLVTRPPGTMVLRAAPVDLESPRLLCAALERVTQRELKLLLDGRSWQPDPLTLL